MDNYYLSNKPQVYPSNMISQYLMDKGLIFKARVHLNSVDMLHNLDEVVRHSEKLLAHKFAESLMAENKITYRTLDHPIYPEKVIEAEMYVFTESDLLALLSHFNVHIHKAK